MKETNLKIRFFGDPALRKKSILVRNITQRHKDTLSQMSKLMYEDSGVGLAAPQVGINERMIVADIGSGLYKLVNPSVINRKGSQVNQEGCLSIPGICVKVKRANSISVRAQDEDGKSVKIEAQGLLACVLQHEIDHLRGRLVVDYASIWEKLRVKKKLEELSNRSRHENLSEQRNKSCKLQL